MVGSNVENVGRPLYTPKMRVVAMLSSEVTVFKRFVDFYAANQQNLPYAVVGCFSDNGNLSPQELVKDTDIDPVYEDMRQFGRQRGKNVLQDHKARNQFDIEAAKKIQPFLPDALVFIGYNHLVTNNILGITNNYGELPKPALNVNVHHGDLSVTKDGKRPYAGLLGLENSLADRTEYITSCTNFLMPMEEGKADYGQILMRKQVRAQYPEQEDMFEAIPPADVSINRRLLEEHVDVPLIHATLTAIATQQFSYIGNRLAFNGELVPDGVLLE